jgi:hypothetical protein
MDLFINNDEKYPISPPVENTDIRKICEILREVILGFIFESDEDPMYNHYMGHSDVKTEEQKKLNSVLQFYNIKKLMGGKFDEYESNPKKIMIMLSHNQSWRSLGLGYNLLKIKDDELSSQSENILLKIITDWYDDIPIVNIPLNSIISSHGLQENKYIFLNKNWIMGLSLNSKRKIKQMIVDLKKGDIMPPILVCKYGDKYCLIDGEHRSFAHTSLKERIITSKVITYNEIANLAKSLYDQIEEYAS